jgi:trehalose 6-phosphate phosphatase
VALLEAALERAGRLWLFLDYDGTLADFAPTPDVVVADPAIADLLSRLAEQPRLRVSVISGRRLEHIEQLVPVPGILLMGTYGIERRTPGGERVYSVAYENIRPTLEAIKPHWAELIAGHEGFFLEDKGWALALHARFADAQAAGAILPDARRTALDEISSDHFRVLGGHRFLEIGPRMAHKGRTVEELLEAESGSGMLPIYVGDDDKDEEAFDVVKAHGGLVLVVAEEERESLADCRLRSPREVRAWLEQLLARVKQGEEGV